MTDQRELQLSDLIIDTAQSRQNEWTGDEQDQRLVNSVKREGLMQPLLVRPITNTSYGDDVDEDYAIIAGSRRYHAAVEAGLDTVRCRVINADDVEASMKSLRENVERKGLTEREKAQSYRMQFELLRPSDPVTCPVCGDTFGKERSINNHWASADHGPVEPTVPMPDNEVSPSDAVFYSDMQVKEFLAEEHLGSSSKNHIRELERYISIAELPDSLQTLWDPERSEPEVELSETLTVSSKGSAPSTKLIQLYKTLDTVVDVPEVTAADVAIEAIDRLDSTGLDRKGLADELEDLADELASDLATVEGDEAQRTIEQTLSRREARIREVTEAMNGSTAVGSVRINFDDQRYKRWHARAKETLGEEANTAIVRRAYRDYLERMAEKHGWKSE